MLVELLLAPFLDGDFVLLVDEWEVDRASLLRSMWITTRLGSVNDEGGLEDESPLVTVDPFIATGSGEDASSRNGT